MTTARPTTTTTGVPAQSGRLTLWPNGGVPPDAPDYVVIDQTYLATWTIAGWLTTWCRGMTCHHQPPTPCTGHPTWTPHDGALTGDHLVIGARASGSRALYLVQGRTEWAAYRLRRRA